MNKILLVILSTIFVYSCKTNTKDSTKAEKNQSNLETIEDQNWNGEYCADVEYYNPNTNKRSQYRLSVKVDDGELIRLDFPSGSLDESEVSGQFDNNGHTLFTNPRGYEYSIQIIGDIKGCFDNVAKAIRCNGITKEKNQCKHFTDNESGLCWQHTEKK